MAPPSTPNPNSPDSFDAAQDASVEEELQRLMLADEYIQSLPYAPYQFQREAIEAWFSSNHGVLVSAPTGMGKTLIAEAALFEALKTGKRAYYTTPLIALTEQKFRELQESAVRWGFSKSDVGLVTGNRRENIDAPILVVVAEILFNRLISSDAFESFARKDRDPNATIAPVTFDVNAQKKTSISAAQLNAKQSLVLKDDSRPQTESIEETNQNKRVIVVPENPEDYEDEEFRELENAHFSFEDVSAVVMDEFHQFSDPERGVVWEFSLALLPTHIRTLLISATVGNAAQFVNWLKTTANRSLELITSTERRTPLEYHWVDDRFLEEQLVDMCQGDEDVRTTPALVFCFNRDECWSVAENVSGKPLVDQDQKTRIIEELANYDLRSGAGPKLEKLLKRGVGIHHAGIMPKYRRIIEDLFQKKLLSFCVCTETLAAGINLPARSVVLPTLLKGPKANRRLVEPSTAQQIFGRAGRPQYDNVGYVFALAPRIDVEHDRALRNLERDLPENSKDPQIIKLRKKKLKNLPMRKPGVVYWTDKQFTDLAKTAAGALTSRGPIPWRLLAHMIECNANLTPIRRLVAQRLMGAKRLDAMQKALDQMFLTLWRGGFVRLAPNPVSYGLPATAAAHRAYLEHRRRLKEEKRRSQPFAAGLFDVDILNDDSNDEEFDTDAFLLASRDAAKTPEEPSFAKGVLAQEELSPLDGFDFFGGPDLFDLQDDAASHSADPIAEEPNTSPEEQTPNQDAPAESEVADLLFGLTLGSSAPKVAKPEKNAKAKKTKSAGKTDARPSVTETSDAKSTRTPQTDPSLLDANGALDLSKLTPQEREELVASYRAKFAYPTEKLRTITSLRSVNPIYGTFLLEQLGLADRAEILQAFESVLEMPSTVANDLRPPKYRDLPPGALANARLDQTLLKYGLAVHEELVPRTEEEEQKYREERRFAPFLYEQERFYLIPFAEKLRRLFDFQYPGVPLRITPVWAAGELLLDYAGDFNKYIASKGLQKQEGVVFRHLLRLVLLLQEFAPLKPVDSPLAPWRAELEDLVTQLVASCRKIDPSSVEETLNSAKRPDLLVQN